MSQTARPENNLSANATIHIRYDFDDGKKEQVHISFGGKTYSNVVCRNLQIAPSSPSQIGKKINAHSYRELMFYF